MKQSKLLPILTAAALIAASLTVHVFAGDLEPPGPPAPTMRTLDEIYDAVRTLHDPHPSTYRSVSMDVADTGGGTIPLMVISPGKSFVLKDVLLMGGEGDSWNSLFDGIEHKVTIGADNDPLRLVSKHFSFATGIVFSAGTTINIQVHGSGGNLTVMGYEF